MSSMKDEAAVSTHNAKRDELNASSSTNLGTTQSNKVIKEEEIHSIRSSHSSIDSARSDHDRQHVIERAEPRDLEALSTTTTNSPPPWSVFTLQQKRFIVFMVALASFFSPLSANIYFPALNSLAVDFGTSQSIMNLTLTTYMIFQGLAPTFFGDLADMAGRRPAYIIGFTIYLCACIGIASCQSFPALLVLRMLQSTGSSSTIALGSGVVADIAVASERGSWMGWATSGPMVAPALAPVLGGLFAEFLGWRWIFWFLVILAGTFMVPFTLTFPETGRNVVGNGSIPPKGWNMSLIAYLNQRRQRTLTTSSLHHSPSHSTLRPGRRLRIPNPLHALSVLLEKDVALLLFYNSLIYCAFYDIMASAPALLGEIYHYNALQIGLCFLPMGTGCFLAPMIAGQIMDWNFRRQARNLNVEILPGRATDLKDFPIETVRVQVALPFVGVFIVVLVAYGWVMHVETQLAAPLVLMFLAGFTATSAFNAMSVLVVDLYPLKPAIATSANNLIRCTMGAGATAVIIYMIDCMGRGWCFTFLAGVVLIFTPALWVLQRWGPKWREERRKRVERREMTEKTNYVVRREQTTTDDENETGQRPEAADDQTGRETEKARHEATTGDDEKVQHQVIKPKV